MSVVEPSLIAAALEALDVVDVGSIGAPGGQKTVRHVRRDGEDLVLKVISVGDSAPDALRRAEREVDLLATLDSPNVVRVASQLVELGEPATGAAWLEEFLDGTDLTPLLFLKRWSWDEAADLGLQVSLGLAAGHAKGVVHRDLSSNNVRCLSNGTYKVLDFGFARHTLRSGMTVAGQPGTPGFLSPEHLHSYSGGPTAASDVFVVGILMYAALVGQLPFPYAGDDLDYLRRLTLVSYPRLDSVRHDLTPNQLALVRRCLHPQPARRYRNGLLLAQALEELV